MVARLGQKPPETEGGYVPRGGPRSDARGGTGERGRGDDQVVVGVDVFVDYTAGTADQLGAAMQKVGVDGLQLDHDCQPRREGLPRWRARDVLQRPVALPLPGAWRDESRGAGQIVSLLGRVADAGLDFIKTENLYDFDGEPAYSLGQGE